jgi:hypothetical protein
MILANVRVMVLLEPRKTLEWSRLEISCIDPHLLNFYLYCYNLLNCLFLGPDKRLAI